jgi:hypothetical protein
MYKLVRIVQVSLNLSHLDNKLLDPVTIRPLNN